MSQTLQAQPFVAEIEHGGGERGAMSGTLQLDLGSRPTDLRAMLNLDGSEVREHEAWLRNAFGGHGEVEAIATPTLRCLCVPGGVRKVLRIAPPLAAEGSDRLARAFLTRAADSILRDVVLRPARNRAVVPLATAA